MKLPSAMALWLAREQGEIEVFGTSLTALVTWLESTPMSEALEQLDKSAMATHSTADKNRRTFAERYYQTRIKQQEL